MHVLRNRRRLERVRSLASGPTRRGVRTCRATHGLACVRKRAHRAPSALHAVFARGPGVVGGKNRPRKRRKLRRASLRARMTPCSRTFAVLARRACSPVSPNIPCELGDAAGDPAPVADDPGEDLHDLLLALQCAEWKTARQTGGPGGRASRAGRGSARARGGRHEAGSVVQAREEGCRSQGRGTMNAVRSVPRRGVACHVASCASDPRLRDVSRRTRRRRT